MKVFIQIFANRNASSLISLGINQKRDSFLLVYDFRGWSKMDCGLHSQNMYVGDKKHPTEKKAGIILEE